ncbi:aminotransferase-like domain-containing protein [Actinokineospora iranica]|uniref:DNA-binding transcriptional regulator, MocR family, contains an aminotransferase domain n=1 Tax=Actinokineospora iranica TaxID=1271860 RepID=A0A1G6JYH8_9PSEU|nr:PLP-dependent aminotransferase family protein [Actinokineospora iranica]SDC23767.1 DNA-binding transcriptional regulator, MocR family, contains an aminotransferase domain [Actinokineospora iranica]
MEPIPWPVDRLVAQLGRWSSSRGPLYLLLAERIRQLIDTGQLPPRATLPPDRVLADRLAVGRSTVVAAYDRLRQEHKLERHQGRGTWVAPAALPTGRPGTANPLFLNFLEPVDGVLSLACAAPYGAPPELAAAYRRALDRLPALGSDDIGYYPLGHTALRVALAERHTERGVPTTPEQILVTTGGQQALALITRLLLTPGDTVLVQAPTYPGALELFRDAAAIITTVRTTADDPPLDQWAEALAARPRLAYLNPTNHNPTGTTMPALARRALVELAARHGVPLIDDTVLAGLSFGRPPPPDLAAFAAPGQVLTVGSLSKSVWGGLRTGWIRAEAGEIAQLARIKAIHDLGSAALEQYAAVELLPSLDMVSGRRGAELVRRHDHLCASLGAELPEWRFQRAGGGQCLWVRLPGADAGAFAQVALRHGVAVLPGAALEAAGGSADRLRIPFTASADDISEGVRRLAAAWCAYQRMGAAAPTAVHALVV